MIKLREKNLNRRSMPKQARSRERANEIMQVTATLLEQVGFDELTTIVIAKELGISVGSLYHYFPNKQAILRALAENWLSEWDKALAEIAALDIESLPLTSCCEAISQRLLTVYTDQKGILPLVQAMYAVPELRDLDSEHDELVISSFSQLFVRMGLSANKMELRRIAELYLETSHTILVVIQGQKKADANRSLADLNALCCQLLSRYK